MLMTSVERIRLLIHILRELGESHGITAEKLREAGQDVRRQISPIERLKVLDEIYNVRNAEEKYLRGEICKYIACEVGNSYFKTLTPLHWHSTGYHSLCLSGASD
jgi:hypothetical protein